MLATGMLVGITEMASRLMNRLNSMPLYTRVALLLLWTAGAGAFCRISSTVASRPRDPPGREEHDLLRGGATTPIRRSAHARRQVRITFHNDDRGMLHDFAIPAFGVGSGIVELAPRSRSRSRCPTSRDATYTCTPHSAMMSGRISSRSEVAGTVLLP